MIDIICYSGQAQCVCACTFQENCADQRTEPSEGSSPGLTFGSHNNNSDSPSVIDIWPIESVCVSGDIPIVWRLA